MMKERQEERQILELEQMQEAAGGKKRVNRVDWMYSGPSSGQAGTTEEMEGYLLGKRRIDGLVKGTENKKLEKAATAEESFMALQHANTVKDTASKIREDPLLAIKRQEQGAYEAMMNDPVRRRLLLKAAGKDVEAKEKDQKHRKQRHHSDRGERKHRRYEDHHDTDRNHKRRRIHDDERLPRDSRPHDRWQSPSSSNSRSPSPYRRRSPSPYYRPRKSSIVMRRSKSPDEYRNDHHRLSKSKSLSSLSFRHSPKSRFRSPPRQDKDRAAKLAAMQQAASDLDLDRGKRVAAMTEREERDMEADEAARARSAKYGGTGDFIKGMNRKAGDMGLGERMRRGRGGYQRERDD